ASVSRRWPCAAGCCPVWTARSSPRPGPSGPPRATLASSIHSPLVADNAIEVEGLRVVRGGTEVLHGISLSVPRGLVTGLLGPSGCGKTTLMRAIVGVQIVAGGPVGGLGLPAGAPGWRYRGGRAVRGGV